MDALTRRHFEPLLGELGADCFDAAADELTADYAAAGFPPNYIAERIVKSDDFEAVSV